MAPKEKIELIIERLGSSLAEEMGLELVAVEYLKEGPDWILRCSIDSLSGIGINECERFSHALGIVLDKEDPIPGSYLLEVSSPGIERPLKKDRDFIRFTGKNIEIKLYHSINGTKNYRGELLGLSDGEVDRVIRIKLNNDEVLEIPRSEIAKANISADIFGSEGGKKKK